MDTGTQTASTARPAGALNTTELVELLGETVKVRQLEYVGTMLQAIDDVNITGGGAKGITRYWAQPAVHRMQVAVALELAIDREWRRGSNLPVFARGIFEHEDTPPPDAWAIWKQQAVSYVLYSADIFLAIGKGAVVAEIPTLWKPEVGE